LKDPNGVKVYAFKTPGKSRRTEGQPITKDKYDDSPPGMNTPAEVRAAQRNLLACAITEGMVGVISGEDAFGEIEYKLDHEGYDRAIDDILDMVTPNTAYVTGPVQGWSGTTNRIDREARRKKDERYKKGLET
jgi:hypothetical protein